MAGDAERGGDDAVDSGATRDLDHDDHSMFFGPDVGPEHDVVTEEESAFEVLTPDEPPPKVLTPDEPKLEVLTPDEPVDRPVEPIDQPVDEPAGEARTVTEPDGPDEPGPGDRGNGWSAHEPIATATLPPLLPALSGRIDSVHTVVAGLSVRLEALGSALSVLQSDILNSIADHSELTAGHVRANADAVDSYRRGTERLMSDLRRESSATEEAIRRLVSRVEDLAADTQSILEVLHEVTRHVRQSAESAGRMHERVGEATSDAVKPVIERLDRIEEATQPRESPETIEWVEAVSRQLDRVERSAVPREWIEQVLGQLQLLDQRVTEATEPVLEDEADDLARRAQLLTDQLQRIEQAVVREPEPLDPAVQEQLERIEQAVVREPEPLDPAVQEQLERIEQAVAAVVAAGANVPEPVDAAILDQLERIEEAIAVAGTPAPADPAMQEQLERIEQAVAAVATAGANAPEPVDAGIQEQLDRIEEALKAREPATAEPVDISDDLALLREEITQLKRRIGVRGRTSLTLDDAQIAALAEQIAALAPAPEAVAPSPVDDTDLVARITDSLVNRLEEMFEVVPDPEPPPTKSAPASKAASKSRSAASKPRGTKR